MRTFVRVRALAATHADLALRLSELEDKTASLELDHELLGRNTRAQLKQVFDTLRQLMTPVEPPAPPKRPIGFVQPDEPNRGKAKGRL